MNYPKPRNKDLIFERKKIMMTQSPKNEIKFQEKKEKNKDKKVEIE